MHTLVFLDPGHFHAALTLRERHPRVSNEIHVYAPPGRELDDFLALIEAFNRRLDRPTSWRAVVRAGDRSLERLLSDRPGDVVILAGRNDRKITLMRRLHDAGLHVLADKPWLAGPEGLDDVRHTLAGGALAIEIMTGRHEITSLLVRKLVGDKDFFGDFERGAGPAIEIASVHHLEKTVNGAPLRRPAWFFDVRVQGDGIADIPTHMVDQAQRLVAACGSRGGSGPAPELLSARRSVTRVPLALFARVTGETEFPSEIRAAVAGNELLYESNATVSFRLAGVTVALDTRWDLTIPSGGGDAHRTVIRGTRAEIRVEQGPATRFARKLSVLPRVDPAHARAPLEKAVGSWQGDHPGVSLSAIGTGWEIHVPKNLDSGHESHFPLVLGEFLALLDAKSAPPTLMTDTLAKYTLLAQAGRAAGPLASSSRA